MKTILIAFLLYKQFQTTQLLKSKFSNLLALSGGQDSICSFLILIVWSFLFPGNRKFLNYLSLRGTGSTTFCSILFQKVEQRLSTSNSFQLNRSHQLSKRLNKETSGKYSLLANQESLNKKASEKVKRVSFYFNKLFEKKNSFLNRSRYGGKSSGSGSFWSVSGPVQRQMVFLECFWPGTAANGLSGVFLDQMPNAKCQMPNANGRRLLQKDFGGKCKTKRIICKSFKFDRHKRWLLVNSLFKLERKTPVLLHLRPNRLGENKNFSVQFLENCVFFKQPLIESPKRLPRQVQKSFLKEDLKTYHKAAFYYKAPKKLLAGALAAKLVLKDHNFFQAAIDPKRLHRQKQKLTFSYFNELKIPLNIVLIHGFSTCYTFLRKRDKSFVNRKTLTFADKKFFFLSFSDKLLARQIRLSFPDVAKQGFKKLPRKVNFASVWCNHLWQKDGFYTMRELIRLSFLWKIPFYGSIALFPNLTEQKARLWRYKNFSRLLAFYKFNQLLTGHTATDRAETLLLHLLRGSGTAGLISIPWKRSFSLPLSNSFSKKGFSYLLTKKVFRSLN